ncbi:Succinate dehydrogenase subunit 6, mitochondrial [Quillaja saponaria]|uniref:Succinate dehydrogenase subunit 6, mitochondrial n=1 Tax=Quillaja saponaria TaxID=32244 RepID=A0AAD7PYW7_QUISA|nr:Succinate dehydrogenase subunit 6, mitochondrial [Quillaja saponaria]
MAEKVEDPSSQSFLRSHWEGYKEFWVEVFVPLHSSRPCSWPTLKTAREAVNYGLVGSAIGALSTAGVAWKYSRSLHGAGLSFLAGGVFGWTFGHEIANRSLQLYRFHTVAALVKFMEWWEKKSEGRS